MGNDFIRGDLKQANYFFIFFEEENGCIVEHIRRLHVTAERLTTLNKLCRDMRLRFYHNLNILKSNKGSLRYCKLAMRLHGQFRLDLENTQQECEAFKNFIGKTEEEICASYPIFNKLTKFIRAAKAAIFKIKIRSITKTS